MKARAHQAVVDVREVNWRMALAAMLTCVAMAAALLGAIGCSRSEPGSARTTEELLGQLKEDRSQIDQASQAMMKRIEAFNASRKPGEATLQFSEIFSQDLNSEQRDVLDKLILEEKDVSYKALLQQIISDRNTIQDLQGKVMHLEQALPDKFVVAKRGDRQQELAMDYLTREAGVDEAKAKELLKQVDQTDELLAGNQVWFFYDPKNDTFRTYVTAGTAGETPVMVRRARMRKVIKERDSARVEAASLKKEKAEVEEAKAAVEQAFDIHRNSLFYHAESDAALKEKGVLSGFLKRVRDVKSIQYDQSLNLTQETTISLDPAAYGLAGIRAIRLLPSIYQEGRDFSIEIEKDHSAARILILDPEVFKGKEVLLALRG